MICEFCYNLENDVTGRMGVYAVLPG